METEEEEEEGVAFWKEDVERGHSCPVQGRGKCRVSLPGVFPNLSPEVVVLIHSEGRGRKERKKGGRWMTGPSDVAFRGNVRHRGLHPAGLRSLQFSVTSTGDELR